MLAEEPGFPVARCGLCKREVLAHLCWDASGAIIRACVHCDAALDPGRLRWVEEDALPALGYGGAAALDRPGCGGGGCGRGGCGR